ncbi:MAG: transcription termination/antitermination NusG family protein [Pseudomonadota bacterium]
MQHYILQVRGGHELVAKQELAKLGLGVTLPVLTKRYRSRGHRRGGHNIVRPAAPGYCGISGDKIYPGLYDVVLGLDEVYGFLGFAGEATAVTHDVINQLARMVAPQLQVGSLVEIVRGPLSGARGEIAQIKRDRMKVMLGAFGVAEVESTAIEAA